MKAKVRDIRFGDGKLIVRVDLYHSEGEEGYDESYRETMETMESEVEGEFIEVGTGERKLYPFDMLGFNIGLDTTKQDFKGMVLKRLKAFKKAYSWIGSEIGE